MSHNSTRDHSDYFKGWAHTVTNGATIRDIARKTGLSNSTISRRLATPTAETVLAISDAYQVNPIDGLIASGHLTARHARRHETVGALHSAELTDLVREIANRILDRRED
ncbi:helix-turn-helix transcriptional regulator [Nocardia sp. NPDC051030]|uniref:helix-turn-helix transcriptional regulator n=1 Tax=Nocardia sp. NPDC051030 TaxID=3155162 RepID=UPI0034424B4E